MRFGGGAFDGQYSYTSRFEEGAGTNPEELIAAAHAGCFSMALSGALGRAGHPPARVHTTAKVHLDKGDSGFSITRSELVCEAEVPGIDESTFMETAQTAKANCPVSRELAGVEITLDAKLL
jgi:osmotically inducible protein OsmC